MSFWLKFSNRNSLFKMKFQIFGIDSLLNFINLKPHKESRKFRNAEIVLFISSLFLRSRFSTNDRLWCVCLCRSWNEEPMIQKIFQATIYEQMLISIASKDMKFVEKRLLKNTLEMKHTITAFRNFAISLCGFKLMHNKILTFHFG